MTRSVARSLLLVQGRKLESIDSLLKRISKTGTIMSGNHAEVDRVWRIAVVDLVTWTV